MNSEVLALQQQLEHERNQRIIATQQAELVKKDLQIAQAKKAAKLENSLFSPALFEHYTKMAAFMAKSSLIPKAYQGKPEDIFIAMAMGYQLGFPIEQSLHDIAVINGRPCVWGDGLLAVVMSQPDFIDIIEERVYKGEMLFGYRCTITRKNKSDVVREFTLDDARKAGLLGKPGPWTSYQARMLQMRARSWASRDAYAHALRGIKVAEEVMDYDVIEGEKVDTPPKSEAPLTQTDRLLENLKSTAKGINQNEFDQTSNSSDGSMHGTAPVNENQQAPQEEIKTADVQPMVEDGTENVSSADSNPPVEAAAEEQLHQIKSFIKEKKIPQASYMEVFKSFSIKKLSDLPASQVDDFLFQLGLIEVPSHGA